MDPDKMERVLEKFGQLSQRFEDLERTTHRMTLGEQIEEAHGMGEESDA
jgi:mevalonate kinase